MSKRTPIKSPEQVQDALVRLAEQYLRELRQTQPDAPKPTAKAVLDHLENAGFMPASEFASFHRTAISHRVGALLEQW